MIQGSQHKGGLMTQELEKSLDLAQDDIFAGRFKQAGERFLEVIDGLSALAAQMPPDGLPEFNKVAAALFDAQQKGDYLLLADLLEYKLKPLLTRLGYGGE
jgi:hypothetical protein